MQGLIYSFRHELFCPYQQPHLFSDKYLTSRYSQQLLSSSALPILPASNLFSRSALLLIEMLTKKMFSSQSALLLSKRWCLPVAGHHPLCTGSASKLDCSHVLLEKSQIYRRVVGYDEGRTVSTCPRLKVRKRVRPKNCPCATLGATLTRAATST